MTKKAADTTTKSGSGQNPLSLNTVGLLFLDTSTRLFVPSVGGTVLGLWADNAWDTKPWFTLIGVTLGTAIAFLLIYIQLKGIKKDDQRDNKE
jgi:hypothetical protein